MDRIKALVAGVAVAVALGVASPAGAGADARGIGRITAKDLTAGTVTVNGLVFRVTPASVMRDEDGNRMELGEVPVSPEGVLSLPNMAQYVGTPTARGLVLRSLELTEVTE